MLSSTQTIPSQNLTYGPLLGEGSFGKVYKGTWQQSAVAIKQFINQQLTERTREEVENEANTMASIQHPHIITFYGVCPSPLSLVMELMPQSLYQLLHSRQNLPWKVRYQISGDIANGLRYLHEDKDIVHRDLKSSNILLDQNLRAKITDFGLSRIKIESKTMSTRSQKIGALRWMAPELFSMRPKYSKAADVFGYSVILWEIASRNIPFPDVDDLTLKEGVKNGEREERPEGCPQRFWQLITDCWEQEPDQRPKIIEVRARCVEFLQQEGLQVEEELRVEEEELRVEEEVKMFFQEPRPALLEENRLHLMVDQLIVNISEHPLGPNRNTIGYTFNHHYHNLNRLKRQGSYVYKVLEYKGNTVSNFLSLGIRAGMITGYRYFYINADGQQGEVEEGPQVGDRYVTTAIDSQYDENGSKSEREGDITQYIENVASFQNQQIESNECRQLSCIVSKLLHDLSSNSDGPNRNKIGYSFNDHYNNIRRLESQGNYVYKVFEYKGNAVSNFLSLGIRAGMVTGYKYFYLDIRARKLRITQEGSQTGTLYITGRDLKVSFL